ncbi:hypothetical protein TSMEX_008011 [Taenia solium]|eukprot:TsM_000946300 transcript=TsM_000946300 gene=TsM_000946300
MRVLLHHIPTGSLEEQTADTLKQWIMDEAGRHQHCGATWEGKARAATVSEDNAPRAAERGIGTDDRGTEPIA